MSSLELVLDLLSRIGLHLQIVVILWILDTFRGWSVVQRDSAACGATWCFLTKKHGYWRLRDR